MQTSSMADGENSQTTPEAFSRRSVLKLIGAGSLGLGLSGIVGYTYAFQIEPHWLKFERIQLSLLDLPTAFEGLTLVCLSDFHREPGESLSYIERVVRLTNQHQPDVICLLGDYVFSHAGSIHGLASVLANLEAKLGVYAILGNHDYWTDASTVRTGLEQAGIDVLVNDTVLLERGGAELPLIGLDDGWSGKPELQGDLYETSKPVLVMIHEPDFADRLSENPTVRLVLSGHSHGGQVKPLFFDAPIRPAYARKYAAGLYQVDRMYLYVTRGIGVIPPRARFNCRPEITEIVLSSE